MDTQSRAHTARQDHLHEGSAAHATTDSNVASSARPSSHPRPVLLLSRFVDLAPEDQARIDAQNEAYVQIGGATSRPPVSNSQEGPASLLPLHDSRLTHSRSPVLVAPPSFTPSSVSLSLPLAEHDQALESATQRYSNAVRIIMRSRQQLRGLGGVPYQHSYLPPDVDFNWPQWADAERSRALENQQFRRVRRQEDSAETYQLRLDRELEGPDALRITLDDREPAMARLRTGQPDSQRLPSKEDFLESGLRACEVEAEDNECDICKEPFEIPMRLPCGHIYCDACIAKWLEEKNTCPMDRKMLFSPPIIHGAYMMSVGMRI